MGARAKARLRRARLLCAWLLSSWLKSAAWKIGARRRRTRLSLTNEIAACCRPPALALRR